MNSAWVIYEFGVNIVEVILVYLFLKLFFKNKIARKSKISLILFLQASVIQIVNANSEVASLIGFVIILCSYVILYFFIFECNIVKLIFAVLLFYVFMSLNEVFGITITTAIFNISAKLIAEPTVYRIIVFVVTRSIFYLFIRISKKIKISHSNLKRIYIYELIIILTVNVVVIFMVFNVYREEHILNESKIHIYIITAAVIIFSMTIIKIVEQIMKYSQKEVEWRMREREYERQTNYIKSMEELTCRLKAQRHDFNHYIGCIYGLLQMNKIEDLKEYTKKLVYDMQNISSIVNVDNPIIGALLNFKLACAEEKKIKLDIDVDISRNLNIDSMDISIILGNAIDNAIEACDTSENKHISVKIYMEKLHLIMKICNTKSGIRIQENYKYKTSKDDSENHGFGLENIRYVVDKYDGLLKIDEKEDLFILNIALRNSNILLIFVFLPLIYAIYYI